MKIDQNRYKRQKKGFNRWKENNCRGTFEWVTGVGKTFAAILSANHYIKEDPDFSVVVCVPTDVLRDDWREEVKKFGVSSNFHIDTIHNLVREDREPDMLILDEIHKYVGEEAEVFPLVFEHIRASKILGLTATLGHNKIRRELVDANCPVVDIIDLQEATEEGYVSDYIQYNLAVQLTAEEEERYKELDNEFYKLFRQFDFDFDKIKRILNDQEYASRVGQANGWGKGATIGQAAKCMRSVRERKNFLYEAPSKIKTAKEVVDMFPDKKFITFGQTTDSADKLADKLPDAMPYHSNIPTQLLNTEGDAVGRKCGKGKYMLYGVEGEYSWSGVKEQHDGKLKRYANDRVRNYTLDLFRNDKLRGICTAMSLDVGFDNADIELAVILSGSSNPRQLIQRIGRAIRKKKGKRALVVQLYVADTQDEKWLNKRKTNADNVRHIVSTSQITI